MARAFPVEGTVWRIELLGRLRLTRGETAITRFRRHADAALLAYLAYHSEREHPRDALVEMLWPGCEPEAGRDRLSTSLTSLRRQLEPPGVTSGSVLRRDRASVALNPAAIATDVASFTERLGEAARAGSELERARWLEKAAAAYGGELLPEQFAEWVLRERAQLSEQFLSALGDLIEYWDRRGDGARALAHARRAVRADPLREDAQRALIRLLDATGQRDAALAQFREMERLFRQELDVAPDEETRALVASLRLGARRSGLGVQRSSASNSECRTVHPAPRAEPERPGYLPAPLTRFFGREDEIDRLIQIVSRQDPESGAPPRLAERLVTLTGPGGSGKTRLGVAVAGRLAELFRGAVWFVSLVEATREAQVLDAIAAVLSLPRADRSLLETLVVVLSERPSLLLLDNFEQCVAEGAPVVRTLLARVPTLTCLVTSRQRLGLSGEWEYAIGPLPVPERVTSHAPACPIALLSYPSVRLFLDRAQAVRADFQLTQSNAAAIAEICRRLEGLPLALELAAARAPILTPHQLLDQLQDRLDILVSRHRDVAPRHRSLRAAMEWSYHLLSPELQRCFAQVSIFRSGWTLDAAEQVCDTPELLDCLQQLQECSLLLAEEPSASTHVSVPTMRYRLLETLRQFAAEHLSRSEHEAVGERHAGFYLSLAERADLNLTAFDQGRWIQWLEREHDNLRAALEWSLSPENDRGRLVAGLRLGVAMARFWINRGFNVDGRDYLSRLDEAAEAWHDEEDEAFVRQVAALRAARGAILIRCGDCDGAQQSLTRALSTARTLGDRTLIGTCLQRLGMVARDWGDLKSSRVYLEEALDHLRSEHREQETAWVLCYLGDLARDWGDLEHALARYDEAEMLLRAIGNRQDLAWMETRRGRILVRTGALDAAHALYERALVCFREVDSLLGVGAALALAGELALQRGDVHRALALAQESLRVRRELRNPRDTAWTLELMGRVALARDDPAGAAALFEEAREMVASARGDASAAHLLAALGTAALRLGDIEAARTRYRAALSLRPELRERRGLAETFEGLAEICRQDGDPHRSARLLAIAEGIRDALQTPRMPHEAEPHARLVAALRAAMDEPEWEAAVVEGRRLSLAEATTFATCT